MFLEKHKSSIKDGITLNFIKSTCVQAYPCGRRRSELVTIDKDKDGKMEDDSFYVPFDPEARLNTEANNIKHSSLNGYTQTYLYSWPTVNAELIKDTIVLVLGGYLFSIKVTDTYRSPEAFAAKVADGNTVSKIFANVLIEETPLFSGFQDYNTSVLRNQTDTVTSLPTLDILYVNSANDPDYEKNLTNAYISNPENYYFSGLSFSTEPLVEGTTTYSIERLEVPNKRIQYVVSLCILEKNTENQWGISQRALLPHIEHGDTENSVKVGALTADSIKLSSGLRVPALDVVDTGNGTWQLQFSYGD